MVYSMGAQSTACGLHASCKQFSCGLLDPRGIIIIRVNIIRCTAKSFGCSERQKSQLFLAHGGKKVAHHLFTVSRANTGSILLEKTSGRWMVQFPSYPNISCVLYRTRLGSSIKSGILFHFTVRFLFEIYQCF